MEYEYITKESNDPKEVFLATAQKSCDTMHTIGSLMEAIQEVKKNYNTYGGSARTPEICDKMMADAIYMLRCEANCGVSIAGAMNSEHPIPVEIVIRKTIEENKK